jgi:hypothetical protein
MVTRIEADRAEVACDEEAPGQRELVEARLAEIDATQRRAIDRDDAVGWWLDRRW